MLIGISKENATQSAERVKLEFTFGCIKEITLPCVIELLVRRGLRLSVYDSQYRSKLHNTRAANRPLHSSQWKCNKILALWKHNPVSMKNILITITDRKPTKSLELTNHYWHTFCYFSFNVFVSGNSIVMSYEINQDTYFQMSISNWIRGDVNLILEIK